MVNWKNAPALWERIIGREEQPVKTTDGEEVLARYLPERVRNKILAQIYQAIHGQVKSGNGCVERFVEQSLEVLNQADDCIVILSFTRRPIGEFIWKTECLKEKPWTWFLVIFSAFKTVGKLIVPDMHEIKETMETEVQIKNCWEDMLLHKWKTRFIALHKHSF
jgi:16S rRNA (cytosine1402-N4)-methyltransferase